MLKFRLPWKKVLSGVALFAALAWAQQSSPDLILTNGRVITVDERFSIAQAVAVQADRIVAVGSNTDIGRLAGPGTKRIDLGGRAVIPGLIDNHIHLLRAAGTWANELRLDSVVSRKTAVTMLRERVKAAQPGQWIYTVGGWTHQQFSDDPRSFSRAELDEIAPSNPISLQESYYQIILNSRALNELGIKANAPDPPEFVKGSILRDGSGKPTGVIQGDIAATRPVTARLPKVPAERLEASTRSLFEEMNRAGLTSVGVPGCDAPVLNILRRWKQQGRLSLRVFCIEGTPAANSEQVEGFAAQVTAMRPTLFQGDSFLDTVAFGESLFSPLHDPMFATTSSISPNDAAQLRRMLTEVAKAGLPLHLHAELHDTIDPFLDQIEAVNKQFPIKNLRWVLAHLNQVSPAQLARMQRLGMYAAIHPWAVINGAIMHEEFADGAADMPPLRAIESSGVVWGFGSDGLAANQSRPFNTLSFAVTGRMVGGAKIIRQTIGREDALIAHTRRNASFVFQENELGSLQPGKLADIAVLDRDYLTVPESQIAAIKPVLTIVGGRVVWSDGTLSPK